MGYRRVSEDLLYQILVRLKKGESHRRIAVELKLDKKTVNHYATMIDGLMDMPAGDYVATLAVLATLLPKNEKPKPAYMVLNVYAEEIKALIEGDKMAHLEGMKPKTAWDVICHRHELAEKTSYETFKRFIRTSVVLAPHVPAVARIEVNPGEETQIDYGSVGIIPEQDHFRRVSAFVGVLSASRLPFIQFCTTQDQVSFSLCVSDMFSFYQGVSARLNLDNLKAGILSPDIYDPTLNRTFAELCEHYDTIADPARICSPKDKGKIERIIPLARELYRSLRAKYPDENLQFLNAKALIWCTEDYGKRTHGTTGIPPMLALKGARAALSQALAARSLCACVVDDGKSTPRPVHPGPWKVLWASGALYRKARGSKVDQHHYRNLQRPPHCTDLPSVLSAKKLSAG